MFVSRAVDHALIGSAVSRVFHVLSDVLEEIVGLVFVLYLAAGVACIFLAIFLRARGRLARASTGRFTVAEKVGRPAGRRIR